MEAASAAAVASAAASEDLHASLEGQLRASRADIGRLQNELRRLQAAATSASLVSHTASSPLGQESSSQEQDRRLQSQLEASEAHCVLLQKEVAQLKAAAAATAAATAAAASEQPAAADSASPVSRDGSHTASSSGRSAVFKATLPNHVSQGLPQSCFALI